MIEGEFQKRICRFIERTVHDTPTAKEAMCYAIKEIIDEIRKEFPRIHNVTSENDTSYEELYDAEEIHAWLRKSFGDQ